MFHLISLVVSSVSLVVAIIALKRSS